MDISSGLRHQMESPEVAEAFDSWCISELLYSIEIQADSEEQEIIKSRITTNSLSYVRNRIYEEISEIIRTKIDVKQNLEILNGFGSYYASTM